MTDLVIRAPAKINLTLDVLGKRPDGYHQLKMVMQSVSLADTITLEQDPRLPGIRIKSNLAYLPGDSNNLAVKAARAFFAATGMEEPGLGIRLNKQIPVCAGTAGGSSDAAAVLRGLNQLYDRGLSVRELMKIGESVGSDVPYCVMGGTALAEGRGEILTPLPPLPECHLVLCKPGFGISTPELFRAVDHVRLQRHPSTDGMILALEKGDLREVAMRMYNVFEDVLPAGRANVIQEIKDTMLDGGALGACMSGTGPTVFGLFDDGEKARQTADLLRQSWKEVFLADSRPEGCGFSAEKD